MLFFIIFPWIVSQLLAFVFPSFLASFSFPLVMGSYLVFRWLACILRDFSEFKYVQSGYEWAYLNVECLNETFRWPVSIFAGSLLEFPKLTWVRASLCHIFIESTKELTGVGQPLGVWRRAGTTSSRRTVRRRVCTWAGDRPTLRRPAPAPSSATSSPWTSSSVSARIAVTKVSAPYGSSCSLRSWSFQIVEPSGNRHTN